MSPMSSSKKSKILFDTVVIVGMGQIGASIGMNLVSMGLARDVVGVGRDPKNLKLALKKKGLHRAVQAGGLDSLLRNLTGESLIILATPVAVIRGYLSKIKKINARPLVVDVGSTKSKIMAEAERCGVHFVGAHPIAGTEKGGAAGADRDLFRGKVCLLTPSRRASRADVKRVEGLWRRLGARVESMTAWDHDRLFAAVSHLPHVLAFTLTTMIEGGSLFSKSLRAHLLPGLGSLKSATRVAASPVEMWVEIFNENKNEILGALKSYQAELRKFSKLFRDETALRRYLARAQKTRQSYPL